MKSHDPVLEQSNFSTTDADIVMLHTWWANCIGWHPAGHQTIDIYLSNDFVSKSDYKFCRSFHLQSPRTTYMAREVSPEERASWEGHPFPTKWDAVVRGPDTLPHQTIYFENQTKNDHLALMGWADFFYKVKPGGDEKAALAQCQDFSQNGLHQVKINPYP